MIGGNSKGGQMAGQRSVVRNGFLLVVGLGAAYYLWKQLDNAQNQADPFERQRESVIDVTVDPEPLETIEPQLEPALVVPEPEAGEVRAEADFDEFEARLQELEASLQENSPEPEPEPEPASTSAESSGDLLEMPSSEPLDEEPLDEETTVEAEEGDPTPDPPTDELLPQADEPGMPTLDEPTKPPAWVQPVDGRCPEGYPIKARFATGHFHEPGDRGYDKIVPDCCYAAIEDAEADGFTPSRWS
jgi:micrococcal nuclease